MRIVFLSQGVEILITSIKPLLPCKVTFSQIPAIRIWSSQGAIVLSPREAWDGQRREFEDLVTVGSHFPGWAAWPWAQGRNGLGNLDTTVTARARSV